MRIIKNFINWLYKFSASNRFFYIIIGIFIVQAVWAASTLIYPMVFDEYAHYGTTQIYSEQWSPFIEKQPPKASLYGDITREPSYLYSYLLSFPYRIFHTFIKSNTANIIFLRFINIGFVVIALFMYRKILYEWDVSSRTANILLLVFISTLIVPLISAHINYDNLMLLLSSIFLLLATRIIKIKGNQLTNLLLFASIGLTTSLVKHNFLPIFVISSLFIFFRLIRLNKEGYKKWLRQLWKKRPSNLILVLLVAFMFVSFGLFTERHIVNLVRFKTVAPTCDQIQPENVCKNFGPWYRNRNNIRNKPEIPKYSNPISYSQHWITKMMRGYFAPFSHTPTEVVSEHEPFGPIVRKAILPFSITTAYVVLVTGLIAVAVNFKNLWGNVFYKLSMLIVVFYIAILWIFNYQLYLKLGAAQAIQARYTYPILFLLFILILESYKSFITSVQVRKILIFMLIIFYVWGGGIAGYLIRSDDTWYWQNKSVINASRLVKATLMRLVVHDKFF